MVSKLASVHFFSNRRHKINFVHQLFNNKNQGKKFILAYDLNDNVLKE